MRTFVRQLRPAILAVVVFTRALRRRLPAGRHRRRPGGLRRQGQRLADRARRRGRRQRAASARRSADAEVLPPPAVGGRRPATTASASSGSNLGPTNPDLLASGRANGSPPTARRTGSPPTRRCRSTPSPRRAPASTRHLGRQRPAAGAAGRRGPGLERRRRARPMVEDTPTGASGASSVSRGVNVLELNLALDGDTDVGDARPRRRAVARGHAADLPRRRAGRRQDLRDARRGLAAHASAAPTSSSASSRPTAVARPQAQLRDLEVIPRARGRVPRRTTFEEMDVDAVLARRPAVVLVDELAHTNVPGQPQREALAGRRGAARRRHRRHLDGQHPAPRVAQRRGRADHRRHAARDGARRRRAPRRPDRARRHDARGAAPADGARQHLPARAGRRRAGQLLPARATSPRCASWRCSGWPTGSRSPCRATSTPTASPTRGRRASASSSALTGAPGGRQLIRRAARIAGRVRGELIGVHVVQSDGLRNDAGPALTGNGASSRSSAAATARSSVNGCPRPSSTSPAPRRPRRWSWAPAGAAAGTSSCTAPSSTPSCGEADGFDVHVIAQRAAGDEDGDSAAAGDLPRPRAAHRRRRPPRRRIAAWLLVICGLPLLTVILAAFRDQLSLATDLLLFLALAVAVALLGGFAVGLVAAIASSLLVNWYFTPPIHTFTISDPENVIAVIIFVAAAQSAPACSSTVSPAQPRGPAARAEAAALARTSAILIGEPDPVPGLLDQLRSTFSLDAVSLLSNRDDGWIIDASAGDDPPTEPFDGQQWPLTADGTTVLVVQSGKLSSRRPARAADLPRQPRAGPSVPAPAGRGLHRRNWRRPISCAPLCCRRSATTCARRWRRSRRRRPASSSTTSRGARAAERVRRHDRRRRSTG